MIAIKGMEMPKNCLDCPIRNYRDDEGNRCDLTGLYNREDCCPLVEIVNVEDIQALSSVTPTHIEQEPFMNKSCAAHQICHEDKNKILDLIRAEIEDSLYVDSLIFTELFDFKDGRIEADDVIEEFNRITRLEVLKIIDKYKEENGG